MAGGSSSGSALHELKKPAFISIDVNDTLYICDHDNDRIQQWMKNALSGVTVADAADGVSHPEGITFDGNGFMYVTGHADDRVLRFSPNFAVATNVAGQLNSGGSSLNQLNKPMGLAVDQNLNLYVAERDGKRVMRWAPNATSGSVVISGAAISAEFYGLLLSRYSSNQAYVSSANKHAVYLWSFNSSIPDVTLTAVDIAPNQLNGPQGLKYDSSHNLYVADTGAKRVVMYCNNSTVGRVVINRNGTTPTLNKPLDIAFDSKMSLYVSDEGLHQVIRFDRV